MHEHVTSWLVFYLIGYIGIIYHVGKNALRLGRTFDALFQYLKANSLVVFNTLLIYNGVCAMWGWTDFFSFLGLFKGELNGMTVLLGYTADSIFADAIGFATTKLNERKKQREEKPSPVEAPKP